MNGTPACRSLEPTTVAGDTTLSDSAHCAYLGQRGPECFARDLYERQAARPFDDLAHASSGRPVTLCYLWLADAVDRVVDRKAGTLRALRAFRDASGAI